MKDKSHTFTFFVLLISLYVFAACQSKPPQPEVPGSNKPAEPPPIIDSRGAPQPFFGANTYFGLVDEMPDITNGRSRILPSFSDEEQSAVTREGWPPVSSSAPSSPATPQTPPSSSGSASTPPPASAPDLAFPPTSDESLENQVIALVNKERDKIGLAPLINDAALTGLARTKSSDMAVNDYFSHVSPTLGGPSDLLRSAQRSYTALGENIAYGQRSAEAVVSSWMSSESHRANILGENFGRTGVGMAQSAQGVYYWTQIFTD